MIDLKALRYFIHVAEAGSFTRASIQLGVAQPVLSRQIRQLEVSLRQNLLTRNGRGVALTEAGKTLFEYGQGILRQIARLEDELARLRGAAVGRVSLGLPPSLARAFAARCYQTLQRQLPNVLLSLTENLTIRMIEDLKLGKIDLAVLYQPPPDPALTFTPLGSEPLVLVSSAEAASAQHAPSRCALAELAQIPLLLPSRHNAVRALLDAELVAQGLSLSPAAEIDSVGAILELTAAGAGSAVLPRSAVSNMEGQGRYHLRLIGNPELRISVLLAANPKHPESHAQRAVAAALATLFPALLD